MSAQNNILNKNYYFYNLKNELSKLLEANELISHIILKTIKNYHRFYLLLILKFALELSIKIIVNWLQKYETLYVDTGYYSNVFV